MNIIRNSNNDIFHNTSNRVIKPKFIVVHATADSGATSENEVAYFNKKTTTRASADLFVDSDIRFYNNDILHRYSWAVGGRKLATGGGSMHGIVKNNNSISIEMCCYKDQNGRWSITDQTYINTIFIIKYLMGEYGINADHVVRHYDVTGKLCPCVFGFISENGGSDSIWQKMKSDIKSDAEPVKPEEKPEQKPVHEPSVKLVVDGRMGTETTKATQKFFGTPQDGVISGQYEGYVKRCPGILTMRAGHGGSMVVRALQKWLGVTSDGSLGPQTVRAWQRRMNTPIDGIISNPSCLIKAWQIYLNEVI